MTKTNQIVMQVTKNVNKKGKLKGKNKKETKVLKAMCPHHKMTKHGKMKDTIWINDGEYCICTLCNERFPASFFSDDEIDKIVNEMKELNNQNKFTAVATCAGDDAVKFFADTAVKLSKYKKISKKTKKLAEKQTSVKKNKKKNQNHGSSKFGSWSTNNNRR